MTVENLFGPVLTLGRVERSVMAHVRLWVPTYLPEVERSEGVRADGVTPLEPGSLPLPKSYRPADRLDKWPADQLPALIFGSPGLGDDGPRRRGDGAISGGWVFSLTAVASGRDDETTRWLCGIYTATLRLLFAQQPLIAGLDVESCAYEDEAYDGLPFSRSGSLMAGTVTFTLGLGGLASSAHGPAEPLADPLPDPGPWPTVQDTSLTVEKENP